MHAHFPAICLSLLLVGCIDYKVRSIFASGGAAPGSDADEAETQVDFWEASKTDLLFFGDTSDSMWSELQTMGDNALAFMDRLDDYDTSWQLAVVTGPSGCGPSSGASRRRRGWASRPSCTRSA